MQASPPPVPSAPAAGISLQDLFWQSRDLFTLLLVLGSVAAGAFIVRVVLEVRKGAVLPEDSERTIRRLIQGGKTHELSSFVERDASFVSRVVRAALGSVGGDRASMREAGELAASEQCAALFRKIEPLNIIGNLGPLLGLAGTVWGMVIAFAALGQAGGQANPAVLSMGISKALFHTLLGLCLAIPCLMVFGFYRSVIDRHCTRAMVVSAEMVEKLPEEGTGDKR
ncbi:MAG: MotA/TolQ/ExbB proton channel family protein [Phycisphaerales bacterium]